MGYWGKGAYFTPNREMAKMYTLGEQTPIIYDTYLNITNPKKILMNEKIGDSMLGALIVDNDGVVAELPKELIDPNFSMTEYVVINPTLIKLAEPFTYDDAGNLIDITKRFDFTNPDIRYGLIPLSIGLGYGTIQKQKHGGNINYLNLFN